MLDNHQLVGMYRKMLEIRYTEEKLVEMRNEGYIKGSLHLEIGQEAVAVGACWALKKEDYITSTHRGHGHYIAKGADIKKIIAEIAGKRTGYCKGRAGHMIIAAREVGLLGGTGIVGGMLPISVGYGLAFQVKGTSQVVASFFGDGASNQGTFHEALNMAAIWKLPCVYICENNGYALSTPATETVSVENIADRARGYGVPGIVVEGNDPLAVYEVVSEAVARARRGEGPSLIETKTYRICEFSSSDLGGYRSEEEVNRHKKADPILRFESVLQDMGIVDAEELKSIQLEVNEKIVEAAQFAIDSPYPTEDDLLTDLYV
jgi:TPP-dependent pyruvate/acetoin dehydrogenase alpha subunit